MVLVCVGRPADCPVAALFRSDSSSAPRWARASVMSALPGDQSLPHRSSFGCSTCSAQCSPPVPELLLPLFARRSALMDAFLTLHSEKASNQFGPPEQLPGLRPRPEHPFVPRLLQQARGLDEETSDPAAANQPAAAPSSLEERATNQRWRWPPTGVRVYQRGSGGRPDRLARPGDADSNNVITPRLDRACVRLR